MRKFPRPFALGGLWQGIIGRRLAKNFAIGAMGSVLLVGIGVFRTAFLTKILPVESYGHVIMALNLIPFLNLIFAVGTSELIFKYYPHYQLSDAECGRNSFLIFCLMVCLVPSVLLTTALVLFAGPISHAFYGIPTLESLLIIAAIGYLFSGFDSFSIPILRLHNRFGTIVKFQLGASLAQVTTLLSCYLLIDSLPLTLVAATYGLSCWIQSLPIFYLAKKFSGMRLSLTTICSWRSVVKSHNDLLSTLLNTNVRRILKLADTDGGTFLLGVFAGPTQVAIYNVALQFMRPISLLQGNLVSAVFPEIMRMHAAKEQSSLLAFTRQLTLLGLLAGAGLFLASLALGDTLVRLLTTSEYIGAAFALQAQAGLLMLTLSSITFYPLALCYNQLFVRNLALSSKFIFIFGVMLTRFDAITLIFAQITGELIVRLCNDLPLYLRIKRV